MEKNTFLNHDKPLLTVMVQADTPQRIEELVSLGVSRGGEAFGMQFCRMKEEYRNRETYSHLFSLCDKPIYVTNYRGWYNKEKSDEVIAAELVELAECGATLCDVMGDMFDRQPGEMTCDPVAVDKQKKLIADIHAAGGEVLMSSHIFNFTPAEKVLEIALEQQSRGADICKIVTGAGSMAEQIENLRIINLLKEKLDVPFLFLAGGECTVLRRIGGNLGCCMYLCVAERDEFSTRIQPLLEDVKLIRDLLLEAK